MNSRNPLLVIGAAVALAVGVALGQGWAEPPPAQRGTLVRINGPLPLPVTTATPLYPDTTKWRVREIHKPSLAGLEADLQSLTAGGLEVGTVFYDAPFGNYVAVVRIP
jgi:hypothetical protein